MTIVEQAINTAKRNITARQKGGVLQHLAIDENPIQVRLKRSSSIQSANWVFDGSAHVITVGERLPAAADLAGITDKHRKDFCVAVLRHEAEHARQTSRDPRKIARILKEEKIPFRLLNLFEDCRIEHRAGKASVFPFSRGHSGTAWGWKKWQAIASSTNNPTEAILTLKICEAGSKSAPYSYLPEWTGAEYVEYFNSKKTKGTISARKAIVQYYRRAIKCETTEDLLPLLIDFCKTFGKSFEHRFPEDEIAGEKCPCTDEQPENLREMKSRPACEADPSALAWNDWPQAYDGSRAASLPQARRIASKLASLIKNGAKRPTRVSQSGSRLHVPNVISGNSAAFRSIKQDAGKRKICLVIDQSGSMGGIWETGGGKEFCAAFRMLAQQNILDVQIILTAKLNGKHAHLNASGRNPEQLMQLSPCGGAERVQATLRKYRHDLVAADSVVIFTDGALTDGDIDTDYYRRQGVDLLAACVNVYGSAKSMRRAMNQHFAKSFISKDANELAQRLAQHIINK